MAGPRRVVDLAADIRGGQMAEKRVVTETTTEPVVAALTCEQMKELLGTREGVSATDLAKAVAEGAAKAGKPENAVHPGISVYSHPEGEVARPKDKLKCRMFIGGGPLEEGTLTPAEIDALNLVTPGFYRIKKSDDSETILEVRGQVNANKEIEKLWIVIHPEDPDKNGFGTLTKLVRQFTDANRVQPVAA
jgi:hypothetical protein